MALVIGIIGILSFVALVLLVVSGAIHVVRDVKPQAGAGFWAIRDNEINGHIWLLVDKPRLDPKRTFGFDGDFVAMIPCHALATFPELQDLKYGDEPRRVRIEVLHDA